MSSPLDQRSGYPRWRRWFAILLGIGLILEGVVLYRAWRSQLNSDEQQLLGQWSFDTPNPPPGLRVVTFREDRLAPVQMSGVTLGVLDWSATDGKLMWNEYIYRDVKNSRGYETVRAHWATFNGTMEKDIPDYFQITWKTTNEVELREIYAKPGSTPNRVVKLKRVTVKPQ